MSSHLMTYGTSASSIKTRIKTRSQQHLYALKSVRVHLPLKQGLRQPYISLVNVVDDVRVHLPLKQGLRPFVH